MRATGFKQRGVCKQPTDNPSIGSFEISCCQSVFSYTLNSIKICGRYNDFGASEKAQMLLNENPKFPV